MWNNFATLHMESYGEKCRKPQHSDGQGRALTKTFLNKYMEFFARGWYHHKKGGMKYGNTAEDADKGF